MSKEEKRIKVTYKHPNPLFEKWLEEWRDEAALKNSNLQYCFSKALRSLKKYPLPLKSGKECLILDSFGQGLCGKLDKKLEQYRKTHLQSDSDESPDVAPSTSAFIVNNQQKAKKPATKRKLSEDKPTSSTSAPKKQQRVYVPGYRSAPYALLLTIYGRQNKASYPGFMTKAELQKSAQPLCDASFYKPDPGTYYTAWSSMSTLIKKALVAKTGQPARFSLTDEGTALAKQLEEADTPNEQNQSQSSLHSYRATPKKNKVTRRKPPEKYTNMSEEGSDPDEPDAVYFPDSSPVKSPLSKPSFTHKTSHSLNSNKATVKKTKVTRKKPPEKYTNVSEEDSDPDEPDAVYFPDSSPVKSPLSKPSFTYKTSYSLDSNKAENSNYSSANKQISKNIPLILETYSLSDSEDEVPNFSISSPRKPLKKNTSPSLDLYGLSEFDDKPERIDSLPATFQEKRKKEAEKPKSSNIDEPIVLGDSPSKSEDYFDSLVKNSSQNDNPLKKVTCVSLILSDSDDDHKESESLPVKNERLQHNLSKEKTKQSNRQKSHNLSEMEDNPVLHSDSKQQKKPVSKAKDTSVLSYSLSEDESDLDVKKNLLSARWSQNRSKIDKPSTAPAFSAKSYNQSPSTDENVISSHKFKAPENKLDASPDTRYEAMKSGVSKSSTKNLVTKAGTQFSNDEYSSCPSTDNLETITDLYFGNDDDDYLMSQINFDPPESSKRKEKFSSVQNKLSQVSSQASSSTCSTKSSISKQSSKMCSDSSQSNSQDSDFHIFMPHTFDVILIVDSQETTTRLQKPFLLELDNNGTNYEVRHLKVGDYIWIARCKTTNTEVVLPYIIERKRMDDLGCSIKDGRFHEQKVRLKQSGIEKLIYLVEMYGGFYGLPETTVHQAAINTYVVDNFQLKYTSDYKHSAAYLSTLTRLISKQFKDKTLASCNKNSLPDFDVHSDFVSLMTFKDFAKGMSKVRNYTIKEMFIKHLLQLHGMSVEKAVAITDKYPTPKSLLLAYENGGGENMLASMTFGLTKRSIGPAISKNIYLLYTSKTFP